MVGIAGAGKSTMLESARRAWEAQGYSVKGAALAGTAAENLETASGIHARTLASWELSWAKGHDQLTQRDVLVIDEAGLVGTPQLSRILDSVERQVRRSSWSAIRSSSRRSKRVHRFGVLRRRRESSSSTRYAGNGRTGRRRPHGSSQPGTRERRLRRMRANGE